MLTFALWGLAGVGALTAAAALVASVIVACAVVKDRRQDRHVQAIRDENAIGQEYMRQALLREAWWFSEDEPTMNVIRRLGKGDRVDAIRQDWRDERKAAMLADLKQS